MKESVWPMKGYRSFCQISVALAVGLSGMFSLWILSCPNNQGHKGTVFPIFFISGSDGYFLHQSVGFFQNFSRPFIFYIPFILAIYVYIYWSFISDRGIPFVSWQNNHFPICIQVSDRQLLLRGRVTFSKFGFFKYPAGFSAHFGNISLSTANARLSLAIMSQNGVMANLAPADSSLIS